MESLVKTITAELEKHGYKMALVPIDHLADLQQDILGRHEQGCFDEDFYQTRLTFYDFRPPESLPTARSILVFAAPSPQNRVSFSQPGKTIRLTIPPTYVGYSLVPKQIESILAEQLTPHGYHTVRVKLPLKSLAVHSGLCEYGRNNITYAPGIGSFLQLAAFFTDLPSPDDPWREPVMLERCQDCKACINNCPTKAIQTDRFLLHAERCLVYFNERPAEFPFPDWVAGGWHTSLIGCMTCQKVCPENKPFLEQFAIEVAFSEAETSLLLQGVPPDQVPPETAQKLERIDMLSDLPLIPRNLGVFFQSV